MYVYMYNTYYRLSIGCLALVAVALLLIWQLGSGAIGLPCSANQRSKDCVLHPVSIPWSFTVLRRHTHLLLQLDTGNCIDLSATVEQVYNRPCNLENKHKPWTLSWSEVLGRQRRQFHGFPGSNSLIQTSHLGQYKKT